MTTSAKGAPNEALAKWGNKRDHPLSLLVFITGAAVLVLEVTAVRLISPYFGNTIYAFSSVITIVLGALSLGYWLGGKIADAHPSISLFYLITAAGGLCFLATNSLSIYLLPPISSYLSIQWGPLISSLLLFFAPSLVLGLLSPLAITISHHQSPSSGLGSISGRIFFFSTAGSIIGSLAAGFFLIPSFGLHSIVATTGLLLILIGIIGLNRPSLLLLSPLFFLFLARPTLPSRTLLSQDGIYEKITILEASVSARPSRILLLDRSRSSAVFLSDGQTAFPYTSYYLLAPLLTPKLDEILVIGGGGYVMARDLARDFPDSNLTTVEIEPALYPLAQKYFQVPPGINNVVADGRRFLNDSKITYDFIITDVYQSIISIPHHFTTLEFFTLAKSRLSPQGIFMANFVSDTDPTPPSLFYSGLKTFTSAFPYHLVVAVRAPLYHGPQNFILVGSPSPITLPIAVLRSSPHHILRTLPEHLLDTSNLDYSAHSTLTDDFAPVESMTAAVLGRYF